LPDLTETESVAVEVAVQPVAAENCYVSLASPSSMTLELFKIMHALRGWSGSLALELESAPRLHLSRVRLLVAPVAVVGGDCFQDVVR